MSSDDHKFPFLNNKSDSEDEDQPRKDSSNEESREEGGADEPLLPWQKKSFNKPRRRDDEGSFKKDFTKDRRSFEDRDGGKSDSEKKPFEDRRKFEDRGDRKERDDSRSTPFGDRRREGDSRPYEDRRKFEDRGDRKERDDSRSKPFGDRRREGDSRPYEDRRKFEDRGDRKERDDSRSKPFGDRRREGDSRPYEDRRKFEDRGERKERDDSRSTPFGDRRREGDSRPYEDRRKFEDRGDRKERDDSRSTPFGDRRREGDRKPFGDRRSSDDRGGRRDSKFKKSFGDRKEHEQNGYGTNDDMRRYDDREKDIKPVRILSTKTKSFNDFADFYLGDKNVIAEPSTTEKSKFEERNEFEKTEPATELPWEGNESRRTRPRIANEESHTPKKRRERPTVKGNFVDRNDGEENQGPSIMRLNKYVAKSGLCSRRAAADLVKAGEISVNGKVEIQPAYEVQDTDVIEYQGKSLNIQEELVYLLLNKPKGYITTLDDERDRKTVMELVEDKVDVRIYPVGRLDRNTSGLLLFTNDGDLAKALSHPSHKVQKFYHVVLDKPVSEEHIAQIKAGLMLEDGLAIVDSVGYVDGKGKEEVGIEIHIGKNRIVRRLFEHFGYRVEKLDRTYYAGLTKKDLSRGWSRQLTHKEIIMLKHFTGK